MVPSVGRASRVMGCTSTRSRQQAGANMGRSLKWYVFLIKPRALLVLNPHCLQATQRTVSYCEQSMHSISSPISRPVPSIDYSFRAV